MSAPTPSPAQSSGAWGADPYAELRHAIRHQWFRTTALGTHTADDHAPGPARRPAVILLAFAAAALVMLTSNMMFGWAAVALVGVAALRRESIAKGALIAAMVSFGAGLLLLIVATATGL